MKNAIIFFLLGTITGVCSLMLYERREGASNSGREVGDTSFSARARSSISDAADKTSEAAGRAKDSAEDKLREWHLTADEIKNDLAKTGEVVRSKARAAGEAISDARVLAVIKSKYVLDRDLSAWDISVEANDGNVTLTGKIASPELLGRAVRLALETDGVRLVTAKLVVTPKPG
jgi:osmotically-inducible protein OsmY